jgi:hypothetical protein
VIAVTIDYNNKPKLRIARRKESWKNILTIVATIDCNNKPRPKISRSKEPSIATTNQDQKSQGARKAGRTFQQL